MPVMDGLATIHALRRINPEVRIIAASGMKSEEEIAKAKSEGVKYFLSKPFTAEVLLHTMQAILEKA